MIAALAASAIALAVASGWLITRSVARPAREAVDSANRVARGDLTSHIEVKTNDEMGQLMRALQTMNGSLVRTIGGVRNSIEAISAAAEQISSENIALAGRTEEQAASLEQTAASMTQLTETSVGMIQDGSRQAGEVVVTVEQIKQAVKNVSAIVAEISAASEQQTAGIEQVHSAISQMDQVTQQNAALVEEAAAAARSLEEQAVELRGAVSVFKVDDTGPSVSRMVVLESRPRMPARKSTSTLTKPKTAAQSSGAATGAAIVASKTAAAETWRTF